MTTEQAKQVLRDAGYYVDNLWHINDVMDRYECGEEQAQEVLDEALQHEWLVEQVFGIIDSVAKYSELNKKGGDQ